MTLAAAGSEMSNSCVITNTETNENAVMDAAATVWILLLKIRN